MTLFSIQEFAISAVYLVECYRFLRISYEGRTRRLMYELLVVNIALIVLDVALLAVEYLDLYQVEITMKGMVYSIKLKLELGVLSRLVKIATRMDGTRQTASLDPEGGLQKMDTVRTEGSLPWINPLSPSFSSGTQDVVEPQPGAEKDVRHAEHLHFVTSANGANADATMQLRNEINAELGLPQEKMVERPKPSRDSSITDLYPGRLDGGIEKDRVKDG